jgi:hypothetical protein
VIAPVLGVALLRQSLVPPAVTPGMTRAQVETLIGPGGLYESFESGPADGKSDRTAWVHYDRAQFRVTYGSDDRVREVSRPRPVDSDDLPGRP